MLQVCLSNKTYGSFHVPGVVLSRVSTDRLAASVAAEGEESQMLRLMQGPSFRVWK